MSENGNDERKVSITGEVLSLLEDQMELTSLELEYERAQGTRRLSAWVAALFLGLMAFAVLQVALVAGLMALGLSLPVSSVILAAVYGVTAVILVKKCGLRDPKVGEPLQGTREEIRKNLQWIRQLL